MNGIEIFSDGKYEYSTALMFEYIHRYTPPIIQVNIDDLRYNLYFSCWKNNIQPIEVLENPNNKKYEDEMTRIRNANTKYPIIINTQNNIIDGVHRYVKLIIEGKKYITVYIFDDDVMKSFRISNCKVNKLSRNIL